MRSTARALLGSAGLRAHRLARFARPGHAIRILYYHSISDAPIRSSVSPTAFAAQIEYLVERGYLLLSLSDAVKRLASRGAVEDRSIVVTLDDGFRDNYDNALPILRRWGAPATVFLTTAYIGTDRLPTLTRTAFVPQPLDWRQVREMHEHGIEFGSHTATHPMLSTISLVDVRRELAESRREIEDRLGTAVSLFCYPRGDYDEAVKDAVRDAGYTAACTTLPGTNREAGDLLALRRTYVSGRDSLGEFAKKVEGAYDMLQRLVGVWRRVRAR